MAKGMLYLSRQTYWCMLAFCQFSLGIMLFALKLLLNFPVKRPQSTYGQQNILVVPTANTSICTDGFFILLLSVICRSRGEVILDGVGVGFEVVFAMVGGVCYLSGSGRILDVFWKVPTPTFAPMSGC